MELQTDSMSESHQSVEPALSSAQPPPYTPTASYAYTGPAAPSMCSVYAIVEECPSFPPPSYEEAMGDSSSVLVHTSSPVAQAAAEYAEKCVKHNLTDFAEEFGAELTCAICQSKRAKWKDCPATECKGQAWCNDCNSRWHSWNPRRKEHQPTRIKGKLVCAICESEPAKWEDCPAAECKGQVWCGGCNTLWHSDNPKRKDHKLIKIGENETKTSSSDPAQSTITWVQGTLTEENPDLHLSSSQQSVAAMPAPQLSSAASAAPAALSDLSTALAVVQSASRPLVHPTLTYLAMLCGGLSYCVSRTLDGRLLVGRDNSLEIRSSGGKLLSSTSTEGSVAGACELMGRFYLLIDKRSGRKISVCDYRSLKKISSWTLPDSPITNLAVLGQTLVVPDPDNSQLLVYSSEGQLLSQHTVSGTPYHVSTSGTDVIVSDWVNAAVSVYDTGSSNYKLMFKYMGLENPTAAAVSSDGHLYVGSFFGDKRKLHVLSPTGQLVSELNHKSLSDCWGLNITGDKLLAATYSGLHLYQLGR